MIRWLVGGIGALLLGSAASAAADDRAFAEALLDRLRSAAPDIEMRLSASDPLVIEARGRHGRERGKLDLHRLRAFCAQAPGDRCETVIAELAARIAAGSPEPISANLFIVVRQEHDLETLRTILPGSAEPIHRPIGDDLHAVLAFVGPAGVAFATARHLGELALGEQAAWQRAATQTRAALPPLPKPVDIVRNPVLLDDGKLLSSLLADIERWRAIAEEVGPELVVAATSDDLVMVAALPPDYRRMARLKQVVREDCESVERCISPHLYRFRDGRWVIAE